MPDFFGLCSIRGLTIHVVMILGVTLARVFPAECDFS
jgi:hypothetical protein